MRFLRNKEIKELKKEFEKYGIVIEGRLYEDNGMIHDKEKVISFKYEGRNIPTLKADPVLPLVTVDMKAIAFIINGADIMRPGITELEEFPKDALVKIIDENNKKPLAIGIAQFSSSEIRTMEKGKVIKNIHYVGDKVWKS